ncbi:MAG: LysR family transcriptional regulator [Defluviimonas denitrificans]
MPTLPKGVTLRALELFDATAQAGTLADGARRIGLSLPAASQQISNLEAALGVELFDRAHRPLQLTLAGRLVLRRARDAMGQLRQAQAELAVLDIAQIGHLHLGVIDDFDAEITPDLVIALTQNLRDCHFSLTTGPSHEITAMLTQRVLDIVVAAAPQDAVAGATEHPLLRDPYVLAVPRGFDLPKGREMEALSPCPSCATTARNSWAARSRRIWPATVSTCPNGSRSTAISRSWRWSRRGLAFPSRRRWP